MSSYLIRFTEWENYYRREIAEETKHLLVEMVSDMKR
jgi:hypothetical protein